MSWSAIDEHVVSLVAKGRLDAEDAAAMLTKIAATPSTTPLSAEPLAVVSMALRLPDASTTEQLWEQLRVQRSSITTFPKQRFDLVVNVRDKLIEQYADEWPRLQEDPRSYGGWLRNIDQFDPEAFGLSAYEGQFMGPSERIFLDVADEALIRAGLGRRQLAGSSTGVFVAHSPYPVFEYLELFDDVDERAFISNIPANLGYHLAYLLDLRGPVLTVNTSCSSSLAALHQAKHALRNGECNAAVVAGVNLVLFPFWGKAPDHVIRSPRFRCSSYQKDADGMIGGEGVVVIVLKRLADAVREGNHIHAVIRGSAMNSDGASNGMPAPNPEAQANVIQRAFADAGVSAESIGYVEGHGTGTQLGDMIEVDGLARAFRADGGSVRHCRLGSIKANLGHLGDAAGLAGLVSAVLNVEHGEIPGLAGLTEHSELIDFHGSPFVVSGNNESWLPSGGAPRRAGVSSFGISGTNVHVVVEQYDPKQPGEETSMPTPIPVLVSARSRWAFWELIDRLADQIRGNPKWVVDDIAYSLGVRRQHETVRAGVFADSTDDLLNKLDRLLSLRSFERVPESFCRNGIFIADEPESAGPTLQMFDSYQGAASQADIVLMREFVSGVDVASKVAARLRGKLLPLSVVASSPRRIWPGTCGGGPVDVDDLFFAAQWVPSDTVARPDSEFTAGRMWVLFGSGGLEQAPVLECLRRRLADAEAWVVHVVKGADFRKVGPDNYEMDFERAEHYQALWHHLGDAAMSTLAGVVQAGALAEVSACMRDLVGVRRAQHEGVFPAFHLAQSLIAQSVDQPLRFGILTTRAEQVLPAEPCEPARVTAFGLAKVLGQELPTVTEVLIDHDLSGSPEDIAAQLFSELACDTQSRHDLVAYRLGRRMTKQVVRDSAGQERELPVRSGGTYVVAGGTGYLGMQVGLFLSQRDASNIVLLSRNGLPDRSQWDELVGRGDEELDYKIASILQMEAMGATVVLPRCDVTDTASVSSVLGRIRAEYGPVHGCLVLVKQLYHLRISELTYEQFVAGIENRVVGTWLLQHELASSSLDFFVMFSSISSLMGAKGASECCAVNQYLDAMAPYLNTAGVPAASLNLTLILDDKRDFGNKTVIPPIDFVEFQAALARFFRNGHVLDIVTRLDLEQVHYLRPVLKIPFAESVWREAEAYVAQRMPATPTDDHAGADDELALDEEEIRVRLAEVWQKTLGIKAPTSTDSFFAAGGTSLTALRFVQLFRQALPTVKFAAADIFAMPTFSAQLAHAMESFGAIPAASTEDSSDDLAQLLVAVENGQLSGPEAAAIFENKQYND
ncbi:beta-ketoacyl synthase N-terminal-like domain-containing protein [Mycobacteroides abscessus]|uniref:beta-ketoacyl synthase N-terminal-like domain-containing protein n=1 Tax=Mycobacteroides abscessus TaxID=36809 RepID=UPI000C256634|nr:beta-ketoacyl synthase N-terminal-like domain-containing protein [Mycobacteroides abscessus]